MNDASLIHVVLSESAAALDTATRYIIRFQSHERYMQAMTQIDQLCPAEELPASIQPLPLIGAISCKLRSVSAVVSAGADQIAYIEADERPAVINAQSGASSRRRPTSRSSEGKPRIPWGVGQIKAPEAWNHSAGKRVKVGVIDTGIDYNHPDLLDSFGGGINLIHLHMPPLDDNGHGTHISGTIAAASQRSGIVGVAPLASIHAIKAFDYNGTAYVSDIVSGIYWCVRNRIRIINMSFGMKKRSASLEDAVRGAYYAGMVVVASSGNDGKSNAVDYPASFPLSVSVGATTKQKKIATFSNRGKGIDIFGPGDKIYSTWLNGQYKQLSGTSMATSHVSGVIALMLAIKPGISPRQIKSLLKKHASVLTTSRSTPLGIGEVNAYRTVRALMKRG